MSEDRNTILANFQAITGIEDIGICLATLEQFNWNIDEAVVAATSEGPPSPPMMSTTGHSFGTSFGTSFTPHAASFSSSSSSSRNVNFNVDWRGRQHSFHLNPNDTNIGVLKEMLSRKTGTPQENFTLIGFPSLEVQTNMKTLAQMGVSDNTNLVMVSVEATPAFMARGQNSHHSVKLRIQFEGQGHDLVFPSNNHVSQVKSYMASHHHIATPYQRWEGWPPGTSDALELSDLVLDSPCHNLTLHRKTATLNLDSDDDEIELDDHIELDSPNGADASTQRKMMKVGQTAEQNVAQFIEVFNERYGVTHPMFHCGPLKGALSAAFSCPADDKKPLIVFLHSDTAIAGHLFCSQVLCSENISQYIDTNFVIWGWDLSLKRMQHEFLNECQQIFGLEGRSQVQSYVPHRLPLMIVITKVASSPQVFSVFEGDISGDALMAQLIDAVENYSQTRNIEKAAELEQQQRNQLRHLQEQEYLDSLSRDREKEEIKKIEEKEQVLRKETEQAKLFSLSDLVPVEPEAGTVGPIADITFKLPDGERLSRRFFISTTLMGLMYYIGSKGFIPAEYKLVQNFPKRQFEEDEMNLTLEELGLTRREILYVEELE